ncbi:MAG: hypothetical protein GKS05_01190 [Nitrospirales bacterium]|nr:hypothetical protein [Nitrospirales bacterium]
MLSRYGRIFLITLLLLFVWWWLPGASGIGQEHTTPANVPTLDSQSIPSSITQRTTNPEEEHGEGHVDPFSFVLLQLALITLFAMLGRWAAEKFNQPSVLGELLFGVVIGNVGVWLDRPLTILVMHINEASAI